MKNMDPQLLVVAAISFAAFVYFGVLALLAGIRTSFVLFAAANTLLTTAIFTAVGLAPDLTWWMGVLLIAATEIPVVLLLSAICLSQAGRSLRGRRVQPAPPVATRPRLRAFLGSAPWVLTLALLAHVATELVWPVPAGGFLEAASPREAVFTWAFNVPDSAYILASSWVFLRSVGPAPALRLRLKNLLFFVGTFSWFLLTLNVSANVTARAALAPGPREALSSAQAVFEQWVLAVGVASYALGLSLRYAPAARASARRAYAAAQTMYRLQGRFEARRWHLVGSGKVKRLARASYPASAAAEALGFDEADRERVLQTVQLASIFADPDPEAGEVTPQKALELMALQKEVIAEGALASEVRWPKSPELRSDAHHPPGTPGSRILASDPLNDSLPAALYLTGGREEEPPARIGNAAWFELAAAALAGARVTEPLAEPAQTQPLQRRRVLRAFEAALASGEAPTASQA